MEDESRGDDIKVKEDKLCEIGVEWNDLILQKWNEYWTNFAEWNEFNNVYDA